ncbi:hypothetical protein J3R30DRAFT_92084 [Lentinula aciculospora]|uniref:Uncharacterized protein n=1 Tax=Lentinula aciculospora TaxID=153920 RepID=A0A9W9DX21_9AGAR|nr:hypothetical protein J3R30DRAFT_92084 [Lentinula aciculospora]
MSYDSSLLAAAPQATREMRQEGYNPYILDQEQKKPKAVASPVPVVGDGSVNDLTSKEYPPNPNPNAFTAQPKKPFYRTRKGIIIIVVLAIIIIAAIIGGAVGGTSHESHTLSTVNSSSLSSTSSSSSNSQAVQGAGTTINSGSATATITTTLTTVIQSATQPGGAIGPVTTTVTSTITEGAAATSTGSTNTNGVGNGNQDDNSIGFVGSRRRLMRVVKRRSEQL